MESKLIEDLKYCVNDNLNLLYYCISHYECDYKVISINKEIRPMKPKLKKIILDLDVELGYAGEYSDLVVWGYEKKLNEIVCATSRSNLFVSPHNNAAVYDAQRILRNGITSEILDALSHELNTAINYPEHSKLQLTVATEYQNRIFFREFLITLGYDSDKGPAYKTIGRLDSYRIEWEHKKKFVLL